MTIHINNSCNEENTRQLLIAALEHFSADRDAGRDLSYLEQKLEGQISLDAIETVDIYAISKSIQQCSFPTVFPKTANFALNSQKLADFEIQDWQVAENESALSPQMTDVYRVVIE